MFEEKFVFSVIVFNVDNTAWQMLLTAVLLKTLQLQFSLSKLGMQDSQVPYL